MGQERSGRAVQNLVGFGAESVEWDCRGVYPGSPFINSVALDTFFALSVSQVPYVLNED